MKAMIARDGQLQVTTEEKPIPKPDEIFIKVQAAAVNRTDVLNRKKRTSYMDLPILGVEVAGIVETAGTQTEIEPGTPVMGIVNGGGYAEYAVIPANRAMVIPKSLSYTEAAAIPEVFLTAYQTLFWLGGLEQQETVLIHAGGSGVGTAAIQLATQLRQATVITTAGSEEKLNVCHTLGADYRINYKEQD